MSDIFISYAREDRDKAQKLARIFEQQQWSVWWDRETLPGSKFAEVIGHELSGAKAVVVLWSRASVASDWVRDEAQDGASRGVLVPALIDKIDLPLGFRQLQAVDLSEWHGSVSDEQLQDLLRAVAALISKPVSTRVDPLTPPRRTWLYLVAGVVLAALLGLAAYMAFAPRHNGPNKSSGDIGSGGDIGAGQAHAGATPCGLESRHRAAELTGRGLTFIDPQGNHEAAVLQFNEAITECPDYAEAYFYRGQSYVVLGRYDKAIEDFKKVLALSSDPDTDSQAQKFIADLRVAGQPAGTRPTPPTANANDAGSMNTSAHVNANAISTVNGNAGASNMGSSNANTGPRAAQVSDIFAADKTKRIAATTRLIIEHKQDPAAVKQAIESALAHPDNKSGVINTLVYLENVDPAIIKQNRASVERLLDIAKENDPQTADHIKKVQSLLND
jgi:tetratricopeptide (TPR) repeat protein